MINKTNISKSQHYVPKFYLKNFSKKNNKIHIFSKKNNKKFCANISKIANEKYFYEIPDLPPSSKKPKGLELSEEQKKQGVEKLFSSLDARSSKALSQFLQQIKSCKLKTYSLGNNHKNISLDLLKINKDLRYNLSTFFVLQDLRTKEHRESIRQFYDGSLTKFAQHITQHEDLKKNNEELKKLNIEPKDLKVTHRDEVINLFHVRTLLDRKHILGLSNMLFNKKWVIGINNINKPLFTSDHPLIKHNYKNSLLGGYSSDEIAIPLTPKYLLLMVNPILWKDITILNNENCMIQELEEENVIFYNHLQVRKSYNYVFSNTDEFYMMQKYLKRSPEAKNPDRSRVRFD